MEVKHKELICEQDKRKAVFLCLDLACIHPKLCCCICMKKHKNHIDSLAAVDEFINGIQDLDSAEDGNMLDHNKVDLVQEPEKELNKMICKENDYTAELMQFLDLIDNINGKITAKTESIQRQINEDVGIKQFSDISQQILNILKHPQQQQHEKAIQEEEQPQEQSYQDNIAKLFKSLLDIQKNAQRYIEDIQEKDKILQTNSMDHNNSSKLLALNRYLKNELEQEIKSYLNSFQDNHNHNQNPDVDQSELLYQQQAEDNSKGNLNDNSYCNSIKDAFLNESSNDTTKLFKTDSNTEPVNLSAQRNYLTYRKLIKIEDQQVMHQENKNNGDGILDQEDIEDDKTIISDVDQSFRSVEKEVYMEQHEEMFGVKNEEAGEIKEESFSHEQLQQKKRHRASKSRCPRESLMSNLAEKMKAIIEMCPFFKEQAQFFDDLLIDFNEDYKIHECKVSVQSFYNRLTYGMIKAFIFTPDGELIKEFKVLVTDTIDCQRSYMAVILGMFVCLKAGIPKINIESDSHLVLQQLQGKYRVASPATLNYFAFANSLKGLFQEISFSASTFRKRKETHDGKRNYLEQLVETKYKIDKTTQKKRELQKWKLKCIREKKEIERFRLTQRANRSAFENNIIHTFLYF